MGRAGRREGVQRCPQRWRSIELFAVNARTPDLRKHQSCVPERHVMTGMLTAFLAYSGLRRILNPYERQ
jgi:hypothetical protein